MKNAPDRSRKENTAGGVSPAGRLRFSLLILLAAALTFAFVLIASFSWIAQIRGTSSNGAVTSAEYGLFEIGPITNAGGTARETAVDGTALDVLSGLPWGDYGRDELITSESRTGVIFALETDDGEPIRPGSSGTLRFRILPGENGSTFYVAQNLTGIKKVVDNEHATVTYAALDLTDPDDAEALDYLKGHILFFTDSAHTTRIDDGDELQIRGAALAGEEYIVTMYWIWPRTISEHNAFVDDAWRLTHNYLDSGTGDTGYNNADQVIGERITHVVAELNVTGTRLDSSAPVRVLETALAE